MNNQDNKKRVTPKLRFPKFQTTLGWEVTQLKFICDVLQGNVFPEALQGKKSGKYPFFKVSDISRSIIDSNGHLSKAANYVDEGDVSKLKAKIIPKNSTVFAKIGEALRLNRRAYTQSECLIDNNIAALKATGKANDYFIYQLSQLIDLNNYFAGAVPSVNKSTLENIEISFPEIKEQQKIADCLSSIDELINLREQKLTALKQHKKGLMQQLFPSHNDLQASKQASKQAIVYPKLRFPQFKDCKGWEVVRISDLLVEKKCPVKLENETEYCLVTVKRRHGGITLREVAKGKEIKVQSQFRVFTDDFLISKRQIVHCACGVLPEALDGSIVSNEYSVLNAKENVNITFFNYFCHQPIVEKSFLDCSSGIVIEKMLFKLDEWMKQEFYFPKNPKEQQAIADCLSSLDKLISEENEQIGRLKDHKKGLMQQLFPIFRN